MDSKVNDQQLYERFAELEQARAWSPRVLSKLESHIRSAPDFDLFRINPVEFAAARGVADTLLVYRIRQSTVIAG